MAGWDPVSGKQELPGFGRRPADYGHAPVKKWEAGKVLDLVK
ncbi:hypothetical protein ACVWZR_004436 [Bradyrhizobium sp. i1.3.1]